jgi:hypothetical protein
MDSLRTLKKRRPKKHVTARVTVAPPTGDRPKPRGIRIRRRGTTLNLASCFALFLGLAAVTPAQAEEYYVYQTPNGALVISNKEPPSGSKIIKQLNLPEDPQAEEPGKTQPNGQVEGSPKPSKIKQVREKPLNNGCKPSPYRASRPNRMGRFTGLDAKGESVWPFAAGNLLVYLGHRLPLCSGLFADNLERVRALQIISRRVEAMMLGF